MSPTTYVREGNTIWTAASANSMPVKVAVINSKGYLQPAKGMTDHRAAVEAFLESDRIPEDAPPSVDPPAPETRPPSFDVVHNFATLDFAKEFAAEFDGSIIDEPGPAFQVRNTFPTEQYVRQFKKVAKEWFDMKSNTDPDAIPPCPPEDSSAGDKTPAVIAWWHRYHPEAAAARYKGRKFQMPEPD